MLYRFGTLVINPDHIAAVLPTEDRDPGDTPGCFAIVLLSGGRTLALMEDVPGDKALYEWAVSQAIDPTTQNKKD